ncbi:unnamed protein product [Cylindrotheca closterium]|uniref:SEP domain-containing protein n=1 Tax=Cylindrotheca closterium TaxID=2856 RepID=A0AAD2JJ06_9STRA|nr:unnamed protein product [Cylindrotheca closterium]
MANVHGLFSGRNNDDSDEDDSNNRFVGGISDRGGGSGLAVEPNHGDAPNPDGIFQRAEQAGAADEAGEESRRTITMYRDGFVVDDGPYRRLDDPANAEFLRALATGRTPPELVEGVSGDITVGLVDKRTEEFVEAFRSFSGAGATLGASSAVQGNTVEAASLPAAVEVDAGRPSTSIAVRLPNGQRKVVKVNLDSSVLQVAASVRPHLGDDVTSFRLVSGFPPKPLEDFEATVEAAGLKGAQVQIQKA